MTENQKLWNNRISEWEQSGISQRKYCKEENISYPAFQYWRKRIRIKSNQFVELKIDSDTVNQSITINLPNGIYLAVNDTTNLKMVKELVCELKDLL